MRTLKLQFVLGALALATIVSGCPGTDQPVTTDSGVDASGDGSVRDGGLRDVGPVDVGPVDAGPCSASTTRCGASCVDLRSDPRNCGTCGVTCTAGLVCSAGTCAPSCPTGQMACSGRCVTLSSDNGNCGACGTTCAAGQLCSALRKQQSASVGAFLNTVAAKSARLPSQR